MDSIKGSSKTESSKKKLQEELKEARMENKLLQEKVDELAVQVEELQDSLQEAKMEIAHLTKLYNHQFP